MSSSAEGNDCGLAGNAASEYGMNVAVKHATLRCYGPGRALILLLIMPFGVVDSQRPYSDSAPRQAAKTVDVIISPNNPRSRHVLILFVLVEPVGAGLSEKCLFILLVVNLSRPIYS